MERLGAGVDGLAIGERVGIPWLGWTCGECRHCRTGRENLCASAAFNGYTRDGGYADYALADARYCFPVGGDLIDAEDAVSVGLYGFGGAGRVRRPSLFSPLWLGGRASRRPPHPVEQRAAIVRQAVGAPSDVVIGPDQHKIGTVDLAGFRVFHPCRGQGKFPRLGSREEG